MAHTTDAPEKRTTSAEDLEHARTHDTGPENPDHPGDLTAEEKALAEELLKP